MIMNLSIFISLPDQELLYEEFMDICYPSITMNKCLFRYYMTLKGLKEERVDATFRYVIV